jgi:hypothetical protein
MGKTGKCPKQAKTYQKTRITHKKSPTKGDFWKI